MSYHQNGDSPPKILVVDDAPANIKLISDMLSPTGYTVMTETSGRQALDDARHNVPDLILLDIMMPGMDGYEVCRQLKSHEHTRDIPVIFMSALTQTNDKLKGFEAGGVDYLTRPFKQKEVVARIEIHLALRQAQQALQKKNEQLSQEIAKREQIETALRRRTAELAEANQQLHTEISQRRQIETALQKAHDEMKQRADELETLNNIAQIVATSTDLPGILDDVTKTINQLFKAGTTGIALFNDQQTELTVVAESHWLEDVPSAINMVISIDNIPAFEEIFNAAKSFIIQQPQTDLLTTPIHDLMKVRNSQCLMVVPLLAHGASIGAIAVDTVNPVRQFTLPELILLETIAGQIAGAIENAHLFDEERHHRKIAEQQNKELDAFAQTVAHDIKNPLSVIFTQADFMTTFLDKLDTSTIQKNIKVIKEHGLKGTNIVDELLLLAGVRKQEVTVAPIDMEQIVYQAEKRLYFLKEQYEGTIILPNTWPQTVGYGPWIEEVWVNYISNGLKYGGKPPYLELGATVQSDNMVRFWIRDNGPGISPEKQSILFTEFTRLNEIRAQGYGLGLSIVRRIMQKLGGTVGLKSEVGQGSEFFFTLPAANTFDETENFTP
ncbi:MAG: response regulator [Anaerolineae bacterium]|nr:response regulator [Anaerolineae bacterium]